MPRIILSETSTIDAYRLGWNDAIHEAMYRLSKNDCVEHDYHIINAMVDDVRADADKAILNKKEASK